jgi:hypothetical protein
MKTTMYLSSRFNNLWSLLECRIFNLCTGFSLRPTRWGFRPVTFLVTPLLFMIVLLLPSPSLSDEWVKVDTASIGSTETLRGIWIAPDESIFSVGDGGRILHCEGTICSVMDSGTTNILFDVWGSSATDVVASGVDKVLLYDGESWTEILESTGQIYTPVWMPSTGEVIFTGDPSGSFPMLYRYDRAAEDWGLGIAVESGIMAFGGANNDVTMVLYNGDVIHTDNNLNLTTVHDQTDPLFLYAAWVNPDNPTEAFGADDEGAIYRFNGSSWTDMGANIPSDTNIWGISGNSGTNVYAVGVDGAGQGVAWHYDGSSWTEEDIPSVIGLIDAAVGSGAASGEG